MKANEFQPRLAAVRSILDISVTLAVIALSVTLVWRGWSTPAPVAAKAPPAKAVVQPPKDPIALDGTTVKGDPGAKIAIVSYSDFECPYCSRFATEVFPAIDEKYVKSGKVLFAFQHYPLDKIHPAAFKAAESVECAGLQDRFWPMHDLQFASPKSLAEGDHLARAQTLGLDTKKFKRCLGGEVSERIKKQIQQARAIGVRSTPTLMFGALSGNRVKVTQVLTGARPLDEVVALIEQMLLPGYSGK